jgi:hypothetical protein
MNLSENHFCVEKRGGGGVSSGGESNVIRKMKSKMRRSILSR